MLLILKHKIREFKIYSYFRLSSLIVIMALKSNVNLFRKQKSEFALLFTVHLPRYSLFTIAVKNTHFIFTAQ
jgi:hypothetical protein